MRGAPMTAARAVKRTESGEQKLLFEWAALAERGHPELKLLHAIPNGGWRHAKTAAGLKAEGVKAGVPDLCLPVPRGGYHGLYIELKSAKGRLGKRQKEWLEMLGRNGYLAVACYGFEDARGLILSYLHGSMSPWQTA